MKTVRVILEGANNRVESRLSENDEESAAVVRISNRKLAAVLLVATIFQRTANKL